MQFLSRSPNRSGFELSKELINDPVGQRAAKLTVWPCRESKLEFETKTLNAKHRGLGSNTLQCLYSPPKSTLSWKRHYFKSNFINKDHIMKLKYHTFEIKKNVGISGYESFGFIKLVVL